MHYCKFVHSVKPWFTSFFNLNKSNKFVSIIIDYVNKNEGCSLKNKTLLLDNARIYHYNKVKQFAIENNITLLFNSPYSPIFNPIESW